MSSRRAPRVRRERRRRDGPSGPRRPSAVRRADGPRVERHEAIGITPTVGLIDAIPQQWAGLRSEPPMSLPSPIGLIPDAIADASPPLDPPAVTFGFHGLRVSPWSVESVCTRKPRSGRFVRANGIAPAARMRATVGASIGATASASAGDSLRGRRAGEVDVLLDGARHTVQRARVAPLRRPLVGRVGCGQCLVVEPPHDCVEMGIDGIDRARCASSDLPAGDVTSADPVREFQCSELPEFAHRPIMSHR